MRILMTGGGTAGHINPALAIADKLKKEHPDAEILFVGAAGRMETRLVPQAGYALQAIKMSGFSRKLTPAGILHNIRAVYRALAAGITCGKIIRRFQPDIAIGTGGYVSGPVLRKAAKMGIPVVVHEANALPGVTVKMLCKYAAAVLVCNDEAKKRLDARNIIVTGNPVKAAFTGYDRATARKELGLDERPLVLSFGGSLGAEKINNAMVTVLKNSMAAGDMQHIHATGKGNFDAFAAAVGDVPAGVQIREYIDDMPRCMAAADLVISRCGAMTLAELPIAAKPSILIPSPYVAENHQFFNAQVLVNRGAAVCIEEKDLSGDALWSAVETLVRDPEKRRAMAAGAASLAVPDATDRIYAAITDVLNAR